MKPCTVLVVEDNALTRKMVRVALTKSGYEVLEAGDGRTAIALTSEREPRLILQDLHLPDMDGVDLVRALRALPAGEGIPILAFSGLMSKMEEARTLRAGFTDYLFKPVEPSRLVEMVDSYLAAPVASAKLPKDSRRILLVDDDAIQGKLNSYQLRERGYLVDLAHDGPTALAAARKSPPDAMVVDLLMPGMTGMEVCLAVRREPSLAKIPVVITSSTFAVIEDVDRRLAREIGANAFVERTPSFREVIESLAEAFEQDEVALPGTDADAMSSEFLARLMKQLEHQGAINASLARQAAMHTALLSIMAGAAEILTGTHDLPTLLHEVLARALDAGGVSAGAIFLMDHEDEPRLKAQLGFPEDSLEDVMEFFGERTLLRSLALGAKAVEIPSTAVDNAAANRLLARAKTTAIVVAPLLTAGRSHGALILRASSRDLGEGFLTSVGSVAAQLGQAVALSDTLGRLSASEAKYRSLFDGVPTGIFRTSATGHLLDVNAELIRLIGAGDRESLIGTKALDVYDRPEDRGEWQAVLARQSEVRDFEFLMRQRTGTKLWVSLNIRAIHGPDHELLYHEGTLTDINRRKSAEVELDAAQARLGQVVASSDAVIYTLRFTADGVEPEWLSDNMARITGHVGDDVMSFDWWSQNVHPDDRARATQTTMALATTEQASHEYRFRRADGQYIWLRDTQRLLRTSAGAPRGVVGALLDITSQKSLEMQLAQAQKMEAIGQLAAGVAHDFNNILTVISGFGEMLKLDLEPGDSRHKPVDEIMAAAKRANELTRQLLAFGRRQVLQPVVFNLNPAVNSAKKMVKRLIGEQVTVNSVIERRPLPVRLDPSQLEQILLNLAVNARDAMEGSGTLMIETRRTTRESPLGNATESSHGNEFALLMVSDTGTGIDPETLSRIFEPFFTTKARGKGTGLGLSTVYGIVKQSGGTIEVDSEPGVGTTFKVYFPIATFDSTETPTAELLNPAGGNGELVLVVEDEAAVRQFTVGMLRRNGYQVVDAPNGVAALAVARNQTEPIDLLLTDVIMPGMTGPELHAKLLATHPHIPVVYMSGYPGDAMSEQGLVAANVHLLEKPFSLGELLEMINKVLRTEGKP